MKHVILLIVASFLLISCQSNEIKEIAQLEIKDSQGKVLANEFDLIAGNAQIIYDGVHRKPSIQADFIEEHKLEQITTDYIDKNIHIYFKKKLIASPVIRQTVGGRSFLITGNFSEELVSHVVERINQRGR